MFAWLVENKGTQKSEKKMGELILGKNIDPCAEVSMRNRVPLFMANKATVTYALARTAQLFSDPGK